MKAVALIFSTILFSQMAFSSDIVLSVKLKNDLKLKVTGVYQTQKDSFACKETSFVDGSFQRNPKIKDVVVAENNHIGAQTVTIASELNDSCKSKLVGLGMSVSSTSPLFKQLFEFRDIDSEVTEAQKVLIGPVAGIGYTYYASNVSSINIGSNDRAAVSIELVDFDPLPPRK